MKAELQRFYTSGFVGRFWGSGTNACEHSCLKLFVALPPENKTYMGEILR